MITETSAVSFRQNLGEMLNRVQYRHDTIVINKDGKPVAAIESSGAGYQITGDKDLLAMAHRYPIVTPAQFWAAHAGL